MPSKETMFLLLIGKVSEEKSNMYLQTETGSLDVNTNTAECNTQL